jgi:serine/threonine protein kinase
VHGNTAWFGDLHEGRKWTYPHRQSVASSGAWTGSPALWSCWPPEQIAGKKVDGRSDLYSLGVMLYQMLAGSLPFRGDSMAELMYRIANEEARDIRTVRPGLPDRLARIVAVALGKRPELRYQDGDRFAADLRAAIGEFSGPSVEPLARADPMHSPGPSTAVSAARVGSFEATAANTLPGAAAASYDPNRQPEPAKVNAFATTAVVSTPAGPSALFAGDGKTDREA